MKSLVFLLFLTFLPADLSDIAKINALKKEAEEAYKAGRFEDAVKSYSYLLDTMQVEDEQAAMNLAHSYYQITDLEAAQNRYQRLVLSKDPKIKSLAYQQLGVLSNDPKTLEKAMSYFKEAIKSDPSNDDARYNYELVKKKLKDSQDQNKQDQQDQDQDKQDQDKEENEEKQNQENQDQENKDQSQEDQEKQNQEEENKENQDRDQENQEDSDQDSEEQKSKEEQEKQDQEEKQNQESQEDQEQKEGEEENQQNAEQKEEGEENEEQDPSSPPPPSTSDKLEEMNISEEKAKMILEALRNSEIQYIQQNRRRPTKKQNSDKPDW